MELPLPPHWNPARVGEVWRVPYAQREAEATAWAERYEVRPAAEDSRRIGLLLVDMQNTFCTPGFELYVPGAPADSRRLCKFLYRNLGAITQIIPTLDTHRAMQVFHAAWLVDENGQHPEPYTVVSAEDVERGVWRTVDPTEQDSLLSYVKALEAGGRYKLTVWPYHAMLGSIGHALVSAIDEAVFFHGIARQVSPQFEVKGNDAHTEHYSVLGPEVGGRRNTELVDLLQTFHAVVIAGQAKSHCVEWTVSDLLEDLPAERVYLLEDCTSPVVVQGAADFTDEANWAFARFADRGVNIVNSEQPIDTWPRL